MMPRPTTEKFIKTDIFRNGTIKDGIKKKVQVTRGK